MFTRDTRTESFLTQMGVMFHYTNDLKLNELPAGWDNTNAGRPVALRDDAILEYACLMEAGSAAPAPIVHKDSAGRLSVLDGIQRLAAAKTAGYTRYSAYIVTSDSRDTLMAIRVLANSRLQGHAEPPEWTKRNAVQRLVIGLGMSPEEVAKMGGWRPSEIARLVSVLDWGFQIRCIGGPQKLPDGIVCQLANLTTHEELRCSPKPIAAFFNAIEKARFSVDDATPYIEEFFRPVTNKSPAKVYAERLECFLSEPEVDVRIHGRASAGLGAGVNLRRSLKTAITILDRAIEDGEQLRYIDEFFQLTNKIDAKLRSIAPHCKQADSPLTPADRWTK